MPDIATDMGNRPLEVDAPLCGEELDAFRAGDDAAFALLVTRLHRRLTTLAVRRTGDRDEAEDLVQDTLWRVYRARGQYVAGAPFWPWVAAICTHAHLDSCRRTTRRLRREAKGDYHRAAIPPDVQLAVRDAWSAVRHAVEQLPPRTREVVRQRLFENRSIGEIARALGCAESTVRVTLAKGLQRVRRTCAPRDHGG